MSDLVEVKIPTNANPFTVTVNGKKYSYPAGATVEVPYEVAEVINQISRGPNLPPSSGGGGSSGSGGADILNENGIIKQEHLPEGYPYEELKMVGGDTLTWDGNTDGLEYVEVLGYKISDAIVTLEDCADGAIVTKADGNTLSISAEMIIESSPGNFAIGPIVVLGQPFPEGDDPVPEPGIYAANENIRSLTIPGYTGFVSQQNVVTPIARKFLPDMSPIYIKEVE